MNCGFLYITYVFHLSYWQRQCTAYRAIVKFPNSKLHSAYEVKWCIVGEDTAVTRDLGESNVSKSIYCTRASSCVEKPGYLQNTEGGIGFCGNFTMFHD